MSRPWAGPEGRAVRRPRAGEGGAGIGAARSALPRWPQEETPSAGGRPGPFCACPGCWGVCSAAWGTLSENKGRPPWGAQLCPTPARDSLRRAAALDPWSPKTHLRDQRPSHSREPWLDVH